MEKRENWVQTCTHLIHSPIWWTRPQHCSLLTTACHIWPGPDSRSLQRCKHPCPLSQAAAIPRACDKLLSMARSTQLLPSELSLSSVSDNLSHPHTYKWLLSMARSRQLLPFELSLSSVTDILPHPHTYEWLLSMARSRQLLPSVSSRETSASQSSSSCTTRGCPQRAARWRGVVC